MNDQTLAVMCIFAAICVLIIYLFEKYMPIETQKPTLLFEPDETLKTLSRAELIKLEERDPKLPMFDYDELGKHTGIKGAKAYVCCSRHSSCPYKASPPRPAQVHPSLPGGEPAVWPASATCT